MNVAVVGAGAVGATLAADLAERDAAVTVFERETPGAGASGRAAGVCYPAFADRLDARLATRSMERFRRVADGFTFVDHPYVWAAHADDSRRCEAIREQVSRMRDHGLAVEALGPAALAERFPGLRTAQLGAAGLAREAAYADPGAYVAYATERAAAAGATIETGTPVRVRPDPPRVVPDDGSPERFDAVVVAAGANTKRVLADAGLPIAMAPYRVQALVAEPRPAGTTPMLFDATAGFYARPWHEGGVLLGDGTESIEADPDDWESTADPDFVGTGRTRLETAFDVSGAITVERAWAGLCTATPDGDPLLGELRPGLYVATGWQGHGFMRAPAIAEVLCGALLGHATVDVPVTAALDAFDPTRFDGSKPVEIVEGMAIEADPD